MTADDVIRLGFTTVLGSWAIGMLGLLWKITAGMPFFRVLVCLIASGILAILGGLAVI